MQGFIAELKQTAKHCDYGDKEEGIGDKEEGIVIDMLINHVNNSRILEKLMEQQDEQRERER